MNKDFASLRLIALLWLMLMGGQSLCAQDGASSGASGSDMEDVKTFDFASAEGQALLSGLAGSITDLNPSNNNVDITVAGYPVKFFYCLRGSNSVNVRGDLGNTGGVAGYIAGKWQGTLTQVTLVTAAANRGNVNIVVEKDGVTKTTSRAITGRGTYEINISEENQLTDASSIKIAPDFQCRISKIILKRTVHSTDVKDPWILFKRWNGEAVPIDNSVAYDAKLGEMLRIESNGVEGFDPISSASNPYVVTYTVDGSEPEFSFVSSNGNWKNGNDNYPKGYEEEGYEEGDPIGKHGYIYRRGIVLDKKNQDGANGSKPGDLIVVRVGIFKLKADADGNFIGYDKVKDVTKNFQLDNPDTRPDVESTYGDIDYSPITRQKTPTTVYTSNMAILDPTEHIIVSTPGNSYTIVSKFSKNDKYDLQSLLNAVNVTPTVNRKNMKTSATGLRLLSSIVYTPEGIAGNGVAMAYYWFIPTRTDLKFELTAERTTLDLTKGEDYEENKQSKFTLKAYYVDDQSKKQYVDLKNKLHLTTSNIRIGDKDVIGFTPTTEGTATGDLVFSSDNTTAYFTMQGLDNGVSSLTVRTDTTSTGKVVDGEYIPDAINFNAASYTMSITVVGSEKMDAPTISPATCYYATGFNAKVKGYEGVKTYYFLIKRAINTGEIALSDLDGEMGSGTPEGTGDASNIPDAQGIVDIAHDFTYDPQKPDYAAAGVIDGANEVEIPIEAKRGYSFTLCAVVANVGENGKITSHKDSEGNDVKDASRVVYSDYIYSKLEAPVLSPGIEGNNHFYPYDGKELEVSAHVDSPNCQIFYLVGNQKELSFKLNDDGTITTNATRCNADNIIKVSGTVMVQAIAYSSTLGQMSEVVTYRYANMASNFDNPTFIVGSGTTQKEYVSGQKVSANVNGQKIRLKAIVYGADANADLVIGGENDENLDNAKYRIYYTTDGTYPTSGSLLYTKGFEVDNSAKAQRIIALVYANGTDGDGSISDYSVLDLLNGNVNYWETTTENCGADGVLQNNSQEITDGNGNTLVNIDFGGSKDAANHELKWKHYTSAEYATGNPIDNVGTYTIAPAEDKDEQVADAKDELGNLWNHSKANNGSKDFQTHKATFGLPASGAYVKFEPKKNGKLTIWCCQEGALYYNNNSSAANYFNKDFLRKRPAYFVDEAGKSIAPAETPVAAGVLSSNWEPYAYESTWVKKGDQQNGIVQDLYTQEQTANIYQMFNRALLENGIGYNQPLQGAIVYLNTADNKMVAGYNVAEEPLVEGQHPTKADEVVDGTGVCLPSASYMKYTFDVKAGKTYFFFGWMTKIGIRGFGFEPTSTEVSLEARKDPIYTGGGTDPDAAGDSNANDFSEEYNFDTNTTRTYASVKVNRDFTSDTWTTLVLPFSVSASEVKKVFGDKTEIVHYRTIEGRTMYFFEHFHQMIVAGTPVVIKPSKEVKNPTFENVTFESAEVTDTPCNDYGFKGADGVTGEEKVNTDFKMIGSYKVQTVNHRDFYVGRDGKLYYWGGTNGTPLHGTRAYINGTAQDGTVAQAENMAKAAYNDLTPKSMDGDATDIDLIEMGGSERSDAMGRATDGNVYAIDGTMVRKKGDKLKGLAKGIYIINGKKVVVD